MYPQGWSQCWGRLRLFYCVCNTCGTCTCLSAHCHESMQTFIPFCDFVFSMHLHLLGVKPYTHQMKQIRANHLAKSFPQYSKDLLISYSLSSPFYDCQKALDTGMKNHAIILFCFSLDFLVYNNVTRSRLLLVD